MKKIFPKMVIAAVLAIAFMATNRIGTVGFDGDPVPMCTPDRPCPSAPGLR
jgi:hypothetical protein